AIEEALLLRELTQGLGVSQREIGRRCGRDDSWVNRRLQLLSALPESGLAAVCAGRLSTWAATRVIAPLARASSAHAEQLVAVLGEAPLSTRELRHWFDHYQKARRVVRERMVKHPKLFLQALNESAAQDRTERLRVGPEGECETDLWRINELICRVRKRLGMLTPLSQELVQALTSAQVNFEGLQDDIKRLSQHDPDRDPQRRKASQGAGPEPARDQPAFEAVACCGAAHAAREGWRAHAAAALGCRCLGQARGGRQGRAWERGARAGTVGQRGWIEGALQHADAVDPGRRAARSAAPFRRVPPSPGRGDAERHLAASGDTVWQGGHGPVCRPDLGLLAPAVLSILSPLCAL